MARGFYTTDGSATTDVISTGYTSYSTQMTYAFWAYRTGAGGGDLARVFDKDGTAATGARLLYYASSGSIYGFTVSWTTTEGTWTIPQNATGAWAQFVITYDGSSTTNNPVIYLNGVSQTVTTTSTPVGSLDTTGVGQYTIGNRSDSIRGWNGRLAEFAYWSRILTAGEIGALAKGFAPSLFPSGLLLYYPIDGRNSPERNLGMGGGYAGTVTGTAYQVHPDIISPGLWTPLRSIYRASPSFHAGINGGVGLRPRAFAPGLAR